MDYVEIGEVADVAAGGCLLEMFNTFYDDRAVRLHVRKTRELISMAGSYSSASTAMAAEYELVKVMVKGGADEDAAPVCVESIAFSSFNPVPGPRRLQGDLVYLEVVTAEGKLFCVTAHTRGFFVNRSGSGRKLDPRPAEPKMDASTLIGLLRQISPLFSKAFAEVIERKANRHPFENMLAPLPPNDWAAKPIWGGADGTGPLQYTRDVARSEDALMAPFGIDFSGVLRDWNEELQSCRELPRNSLQDRILRDRALYRVSCEFADSAQIREAELKQQAEAEAAKKGEGEGGEKKEGGEEGKEEGKKEGEKEEEKKVETKEEKKEKRDKKKKEKKDKKEKEKKEQEAAVEEKKVEEAKAEEGDKKEGEKKEGEEGEKKEGEDAAAAAAAVTEAEQATYASSNNDLKGTMAVNNADIPGLYSLAMAIVDYRGHRVIAQGTMAVNNADIPVLYSLAMAIVDYRGHRVIAQVRVAVLLYSMSIIPGILYGDRTTQMLYGSVDTGESIIPGILYGDRTTQMLYGSVDTGKTIKWSDSFHPKGTTQMLYGSVDTGKTIKWNDSLHPKVRTCWPMMDECVCGGEGRSGCEASHSLTASLCGSVGGHRQDHQVERLPPPQDVSKTLCLSCHSPHTPSVALCSCSSSFPLLMFLLLPLLMFLLLPSAHVPPPSSAHVPPPSSAHAPPPSPAHVKPCQVAELGKALHLKEHKVTDGDGKEATLCSPVETKGILGSDDRKYLLDLIRLTPRDANFTATTTSTTTAATGTDTNSTANAANAANAANRLAILRPELVEKFCREEQVERWMAQKGVSERPSAEEVEELREKAELPDVLFNPNVLTEFKLADDSKEVEEDEALVRKAGTYLIDTALPALEVEEDEALVRKAGKYLIETALPALVADIKSSEGWPVDGRSLASTMHAHGVNLRYLGRVSSFGRAVVGLGCICYVHVEHRQGAHRHHARPRRQPALPGPGEFPFPSLFGLRWAGGFLSSTWVRALVADTKSSEGGGGLWMGALASTMHAHSVNLRYLGRVAKEVADVEQVYWLCVAEMVVRATKHVLKAVLRETLEQDVAKEVADVEQVYWLCVAEMVVRATKHVLKAVLRETLEQDVAGAIAHFLNCFLGTSTTTPPPTLPGVGDTDKAEGGTAGGGGKKKKKGKGGERKDGEERKEEGEEKKEAFLFVVDVPGYTRITADMVWSDITEGVKYKYQFEIPPETRKMVRSLATLRNICLKMGIVLAARDYNLECDVPIAIADVCDLLPQVKFASPACSDAQKLLEKGKSLVHKVGLPLRPRFSATPQSGQWLREHETTLNSAFEILSEAYQILQQVCGPLHLDVAACCRYLALIFYHAGETGNAILQQHRELIINERVVGTDHPDTVHSYGNMALYFHSMGESELALRHFKRTLQLLSLSAGNDHPEVASLFVNIALTYQDMGKLQNAMKYLQEAVRVSEKLLGENHVQVAVCHHALALAFSSMGAFKLALQEERKAQAVFEKAVGKEDPRTKESEQWVQSFLDRELRAQKQKVGQSAATVQQQQAAALRVAEALKQRPELLQVLQAAAAPGAGGSTSYQRAVADALLRGEVPPPAPGAGAGRFGGGMGATGSSGTGIRARGVDERASRAAAEARRKAAARGVNLRGAAGSAGARAGAPSAMDMEELINFINSTSPASGAASSSASKTGSAPAPAAGSAGGSAAPAGLGGVGLGVGVGAVSGAPPPTKAGGKKGAGAAAAASKPAATANGEASQGDAPLGLGGGLAPLPGGKGKGKAK
ncbi:unnamed protein product [Closterium sp. NIES-64]|nr:unnamed protein product [Closterium sp. NIES-64]